MRLICMFFRLFFIRFWCLIVLWGVSCEGSREYTAIAKCFHDANSREGLFELLAEQGKLNVSVFLTDYGTMKQVGYLSPLHMAVRSGSTGVRIFLEKSNPDIPNAALDLEVKDSEGKTPLMLALALRVTQPRRKDDHRNSVYYLMQSGARWRQEDTSRFDSNKFEKMEAKYRKYNRKRCDGVLPIINKRPFQPRTQLPSSPVVVETGDRLVNNSDSDVSKKIQELSPTLKFTQVDTLLGGSSLQDFSEPIVQPDNTVTYLPHCIVRFCNPALLHLLVSNLQTRVKNQEMTQEDLHQILTLKDSQGRNPVTLAVECVENTEKRKEIVLSIMRLLPSQDWQISPSYLETLKPADARTIEDRFKAIK
jgi:hypothetical protein